MKTDRLAATLLEKASGKPRFVVAIAGAPASGKSTLSGQMERAVNSLAGKEVCTVVPMDGFHLDNRLLEARGLLARKGAPNTFDALGFLHLVQRIKSTQQEIFYPLFDRDRDLAIAGAGLLSSHHSIILVEGNYLLCDVDIWRDLRPHFDYCICLNVPIETLEERLIQRWLDQGYDREGAEKRARSNDIPNAEFVVASSGRADLVIG